MTEATQDTLDLVAYRRVSSEGQVLDLSLVTSLR
jgi:hypothetical protein